MFGWMAQTPLNLLRVQEMVNFLATPGAVMSSLATDLGRGLSENLSSRRWTFSLTITCSPRRLA